MMSKVSAVKKYYEDTQRYLSRRSFDIKVRAETVQSFVENGKFARILDIGCGDGTISLQLLSKETSLTLLDISERMLWIARSRIPPEFSDNVEVVNDNLMNAQFETRPFDLIICIGVLAHTDSPTEFVARMVSLLKPGGTLILEFTDSFHFMGRFFRVVFAVWGLVQPIGWTLNFLSRGQVLKILGKHNLTTRAIFRYSLPLPGMHRFFSQATLYKLVRLVFGTPDHNRNAWMGNEYIVMLDKLAAQDSSSIPLK